MLRSVWVWRNGLSAEVCAELTKAESPLWSVQQKNGYIARDQALADRLGALVRPFMVGGGPKIVGWTPHVTIGRGREPLPWHLDQPNGAKYKLLVYLNESGGTLFREITPKGAIVRSVRSSLGAIVLFDIRLWHASEAFSGGGEKLTFGLRPVTG